MSKVYVSHLPPSADNDSLREYFSKVGSVISAEVVIDRATGRSKGFGFVQLSTKEEAESAISELDGSGWDGRSIKVAEDRRGKENAGDASLDPSKKEAPMGYFRAQPLDLGIRKKRKLDPFVEDSSIKIDYKNPKVLSRFMSERGRILPRRMTGLSSANQRRVTTAIKRAQHIALLPYIQD